MNLNYSIPALIGTTPWPLSINGGVVGLDDLLKAWARVQLISSPTPRPPQQCAVGADFPDVSPGTLVIHTRVEADWWNPQPDGTISQRGAFDVKWDLWPSPQNYDKKLTAGVYKGKDGMLWMLVMPWWINLSPRTGAIQFPPLFGLSDRELSWTNETHDASWEAETAWFFHRLDDQSTNWHAMVREVGRLEVFSQTKADSSMLLALVNQASRQARGTLFGGRPFTGALPFLELIPSTDPATQAFSNVALLSLGGPTGTPPQRDIELTRLLVGKDGIGRKLKAHLNWAAPWRDQGSGSAPPKLTVIGAIDASRFAEQFIDWPLTSTSYVTPSQQALDIWLQASALQPPDDGGPSGAAPLLCFGLSLTEVSTSAEWIRMGSVEIQPLPDPGTDARLRIEVFGRWTQSAADLYPVCVLENLPCLYRYAAGNDQSEEDARASADLARESSPIVDAGHQTPRRGTLTMLSRFGPGEDAVITVQIRDDDTAPHADEASALWLNLAPFMVAQVGLTTSDPTSADSDAPMLSWSSNDAQGAQWRLAGKQIRVILPPQAVAEEMDRGNRFWGSSTSGLAQNDAPLRYRFSPPTSLTLQPSTASATRRFEPSPLNLLELVRGSQIMGMTTELAYPLQVSYRLRPDSDRALRLSETGTFYGTPLPIPPGSQQGTLPPGLRDAPLADENAFTQAVRALILRQQVSRANFVTRLAELWVHDPLRDRRDLQLDDVTVTIRDTTLGAPALLNPLPVADDLSQSQKASIASFLGPDSDWSQNLDQESIRAGILHTFEIASEMVAVLAVPPGHGAPQADSAVVESLALSALGASGGMNAAFDHGKTSFSIKVEHGQLSRLVKIRLGRIGALWNRARHVVVYERSAAPSQQFDNEQTDAALDRWPILRKTEEYVELLQPDRCFADEPDAQSNRTGFIDASVFASPRIYVNGAWARDLGTGYELPLWDIHAASVDPLFYPKPQVHLRCFGEDERPSRLWFEDPQLLCFYSSMVDSNTADTDAWPPVVGVDFDNLPRLPVLEGSDGAPALTQGPPADPTLCTSRRFDLRVKCDGPVNLQYGRGATPMLTRLQRLSIARSGQLSAKKLGELSAHPAVGPALAVARAATAAGSSAAQAVPDLERFARDLLAQIGTSGDCTAIAAQLKQQVDDYAKKLQAQIVGDVDGIKAQLSRTIDTWQASFDAVIDDLVQRATAPADIIAGQTGALRQRIEAALAASDATYASPARRQSLASEADGWRAALWSRVKDQLVDGATVIATLAKTVCDALAAANTALAAHDLEQAAAKVSAAQAALLAAPGALRPVLDPVASFCDLLADQLRVFQNAQTALRALAADLPDRLQGTATAYVGAAGAALNALRQWAESLVDQNGAFGAFQAALTVANNTLSNAARQLTQAAKPPELKAALTEIDNALDPTNSNWMLGIYTSQLTLLQGKTTALAVSAAQQFKTAADNVIGTATQTLSAQPGAIADALKALIDAAAGSCVGLKQQLSDALDNVSAWATQQAQTTFAAALASAASTRFAELAADTAQVWDRGAPGLQLARCVGALPTVTPLEFGIDCAAYAYDATVRRIEMTPVLAYLRREGDEALEALSTVTPHSALLDQLELDTVKDLKFSDVFGKFAGMNFDGLFPAFRLPELTSDHIKITHGFDAKLRRAWVNATVAFPHPERENVFDIGPIALGVENTSFQAFSGVEVDTQGSSGTAPTTRTHATLMADWLLDAGGQTIVRFKRVSLTYDGVKGFDFNVDPHDIELHPGLKFLTDFIARFSDAVPSWIDIDVADGRSVGVTASTATVVDLGDLGAVSIGPIDIRSRFGLTFKNGQFVILSTCAVGSREHPIFVQVSFLGGGVWMEARALYVGGRIMPQITIGACLGSMRSINLAGVAQANYSIQLFCYIEVGNDTSIAVGLSMVGSARILGFVTANVSLLLEAHHEGGVTEGTGRLDVSVKISWCFTFRYKQAVRHRF